MLRTKMSYELLPISLTYRLTFGIAQMVGKFGAKSCFGRLGIKILYQVIHKTLVVVDCGTLFAKRLNCTDEVVPLVRTDIPLR